MKEYTAKNTPLLEKKLDKNLGYLINRKRSPQAAQSLLRDFVETRESLEKTAGMIKDPDDDKLKIRNLKRINFRRHSYFLLFRINGDFVEIVTMFHELENYGDKLTNELPIQK